MLSTSSFLGFLSWTWERKPEGVKAPCLNLVQLDQGTRAAGVPAAQEAATVGAHLKHLEQSR